MDKTVSISIKFIIYKNINQFINHKLLYVIFFLFYLCFKKTYYNILLRNIWINFLVFIIILSATTCLELSIYTHQTASLIPFSLFLLFRFLYIFRRNGGQVGRRWRRRYGGDLGRYQVDLLYVRSRHKRRRQTLQARPLHRRFWSPQRRFPKSG